MSDDKQEKRPQKITFSPFPKMLGLEIIESEPGRALIRLPFTEDLLQLHGQIHGGALFALADTASGRAANLALGQGFRCVTLEMKINYISAVNNQSCLAEARVIHQGRTSLVVESEIKTESGKLVAKTLATFIVLKHEPHRDRVNEQKSE
ncbi:MAG: PaaI family thioesterase [Acidobacteria bacterium]|nr:PaaI family thioesterase [Acidobacteriota bacterium]MBK9708125.1 PaaI family thioesterase [Acidobacteriota bacterium]